IMNAIVKTNFNFPKQKSLYVGKVRDVFNLLATGKMNDSVSVCKSIYDTYRDFIGNMTELHAGNPNALAQSLGVNPMLVEGYFELLETIFILEK
ncbi:MAG: hypothetical protein II037_11960, partial [Bacteroidales bacterium]|nr:hypothetical protein [Bacteroidales bacterium]